MGLSYEQRHKQAKSIYNKGMERVKNEPEPKGQKFPVGSFVRIAKDLGFSMSHFTSDTVAKVEYTYAHAFGGNSIESYSLIVRENGHWFSCAWYEEHQLSLITDKKEIELYKKEIQIKGVKWKYQILNQLQC